jgi:hypothetical protein
MYNVQIIPTHNKQKPANQNYPKNIWIIKTSNVSSRNKHMKKKQLHFQVWLEEVEFGNLQEHESGRKY